ncbi:MAG: outer membrane lipoprotein carrier protein LolA [Fibrobacter sp.]|nr:outer membrane lipoprotein carrier protein LolA [Fibrobacter sp.]
MLENFRKIVLLAVTCFAIAGYAAPAAGSKSDLVSAMSAVTAHKVTSGNFKQVKTIKKLNRDFVSTGTFTITNGQGILWNVEKPFPSRLTISGEKMVQESANGKKTEMAAKDNAVFAEFSRTIQAVFSGDVIELEKNFIVSFKKSGNSYVVNLAPLEATVRSVVVNMVLEVSQEFDKVTLIDAEGNTTVYEFSNHSH